MLLITIVTVVAIVFAMPLMWFPSGKFLYSKLAYIVCTNENGPIPKETAALGRIKTVFSHKGNSMNF